MCTAVFFPQATAIGAVALGSPRRIKDQGLFSASPLRPFHPRKSLNLALSRWTCADAGGVFKAVPAAKMKIVDTWPLCDGIHRLSQPSCPRRGSSSTPRRFANIASKNVRRAERKQLNGVQRRLAARVFAIAVASLNGAAVRLADGHFQRARDEQNCTTHGFDCIHVWRRSTADLFTQRGPPTHQRGSGKTDHDHIRFDPISN